MSSSDLGTIVQMGKLVVHIAENGHSYKLDCYDYTLVEMVQKFLESACGIPFNDQLLLCLDLKLDSQRPLSAYKLPSDDREVFLFNKARMRCNSPDPMPEQVEIIHIPDPPLPSSAHNPHPLDDASDPALKALPSYERQFRYHFHCGRAIHSRTLAKLDMCKRLFQEQKVQERALDIAKGNLDHFYKMIHQNYTDFMKCYSQQHRIHTNLLVSFERDKERLRSIKIVPSLQSTNCQCLLDFVKEDNLQKTWEECSSSHKQFENKVSEFKLEFEDLKRNTEHLFSRKASLLIEDVELSLKDHQQFVNEQKTIMQALSKDVNTVKKLVDDCLSCPAPSSLRPHDAVSALGRMYDSHASYLPQMQEGDRTVSNLVDFCKDKKNEMNTFVHNFMQRIAYIQYTIKGVRLKFSLFQEALQRQNDQFQQLKVLRGIGPAYRACLSEVVRRKAAMKLYMGKAGNMAEKLAIERGAEISRREEFLKVHSTYIPQDIFDSMGLYDIPSPCDVNVTPFDSNLLDIDLPDLEHYAPESLLGFSSKSEKHRTLRGSLSMSHDGSQTAEIEGTVDFYDSKELLEGSELVEVAGTSKMEVENAKLKAELASKIALICSMCAEYDCESPDDSKSDSSLKNAVEKTSEALHLKDEYEKRLQSMLKVKQMQCESYGKRIHELEQKLSDQYMRGCKLPPGYDSLVVSTTKTDDNKSEVSQLGDSHMHHTLDEVSCASSTLKSGILSEHDNMTDSSGMLNPDLDSSMLDLYCDKGHLCDKDKKETTLLDGGTTFSTSNMAVSMLQPADVSSGKAILPSLDTGSDTLVLELRNVLVQKSSQLDKAGIKIQALLDEVSNIGRELEIKQKLLDESQMNCAHLENCLHEARQEAQADLHAEYSAMHSSAVTIHGLFERLRSCVSSAGVANFADSLSALASSASESEGDSTSAEFHECIQILSEKVGILSRQRTELLERYSTVEDASELLNKDLEEKKALVNTLYMKNEVEREATKEKISFGRIEVHEIAAFVLNSCGHYEAIHRNCPYYYLSAESVALFVENLPSNPSYIVGQVVHIERRIVKSDRAESTGDPVDILTPESGTSRLTSTSNPYELPVGCEYFVVTIAMLPDKIAS